MNPAHLVRVGGLQPQQKPEVRKPENPTTNFLDILRKAESEQPVQFSKHATLRLESRNIALTGDQMDRVANGIGRAGQKGIRDSLVLVDDVALVVNVPSRTVVTAIAEPAENVFSNIDGAVIV